MLKTRVTLGNISRILLDLTKKLIFVMYKDSSSLSMFTHSTFTFSLYFTNYGCLSPYFLFPCLTCLVSFMICIFNSEEFNYGTFEDSIGLFNSLYRSFFVSEPLLGNNPVTMAILQKCLGTFSS